MSVGHGAPGLRSAQRSFAALVRDSAAHRRPFVTVELGVEVVDWSLLQSDIWVALCHNVVDGILRDVVAVQVSPGGGAVVQLDRVQQIADLGSIPGFWTNIHEAKVAPPFDPEGDFPQPTGDLYPPLELYIRMPDDSNPTGSYVMALLAFRYSTMGEVHPAFGKEQFPNANLDDWASNSALQQWGGIQSINGGSSPATLTQDALVVAEGKYSARIEGGVDQTRGRGIGIGLTTVLGRRFAVAGYYRTPATQHPALEPRVLVQNGTPWVLADGVTTSSATALGFPIAPTYGEWRTFYFEFNSFNATGLTSFYFFLFNNAGGGRLSGQLWLDRLQLKPVLRHEYWEPRLSAGAGLPELEIGTQSVFWQQKPVGLGDLTLDNLDGRLYPIYSSLKVAFRRVSMWVGGSLSDGQEVLAADWRPQGTAVLSGSISANDRALRMRMTDERSLLHRPTPPRRFSKTTTPNMDPRKVDQPIPITFSYNGIEPVRVDRNANGFGIYQTADPTLGAVGTTGAPADGVWVHPTQEDADSEINHYFLTKDVHWRYVPSSGNVLVEVLEDVRNMAYDRSGRRVGDGATFDFDIGGATLTSVINMVGPASLVASTLQAAMNATAAVANIVVLINQTTHRFRVHRGGATINLRGETGPNASFNYWQYLGFRSGDKTTANDYTAENNTFDDPDRDHFVRMLAYGYTDDLGLITGVFGALVSKHAHCAQWILMFLMERSIAQICLPCVAAAAALEAGTAGANNDFAWAHEISESNTAEMLGRIESGLGADIVVDGYGVWHIFVNELETTAVAEFTDTDLFDFEMWVDPDEFYDAVRVEHGWTAGVKRHQIIELSDARAHLFAGVSRKLSVTTMSASFSTQPDHRPMKVARRHRILATAAPRRIRFSCFGRLTEALPGRKIRVTRAAALDPSGRLDGVMFRIRKLRHDQLGGISRCVAVEDVDLDP